MTAPRLQRQRSSDTGETNRLRVEDRAVHDWYRFVLSFPAHLVKEYAESFELDASQTVLDPFCGTGTTLVECKKLGIRSLGIEANPMPYFASCVKTDWNVDSEDLFHHARDIAAAVLDLLEAQGFGEYENDVLPIFSGREPKGHRKVLTLPPEQSRLLLKDSISPIPLHKVLTLRDYIEQLGQGPFVRYERLALAKTIVIASNLHFGPEVGVGDAKLDAPVVSIWLGAVAAMAVDLRTLGRGGSSLVHSGDARDVGKILSPNSIDAVITSPPYPNEKDYTRTTRLESVILGYFKNVHELRALKKTLVRSNTRSVYKEDDDHAHVADHPEIGRIAREIEERRIALGKTSGFERQYARVTKLYFGGMTRHFAELRTVLRPGARLAYVVGDQASYLRVMIRTGELLAGIASSLGYEVMGLDLFRTRLATATKEQLREEVVLLRWPG